MIAAGGGHLAVVERLPAAGASEDVKAARGASALILASEIGNDAVVNVLLAAGADVEARGDDGATALLQVA